MKKIIRKLLIVTLIIAGVSIHIKCNSEERKLIDLKNDSNYKIVVKYSLDKNSADIYLLRNKISCDSLNIYGITDSISSTIYLNNELLSFKFVERCGTCCASKRNMILCSDGSKIFIALDIISDFNLHPIKDYNYNTNIYEYWEIDDYHIVMSLISIQGKNYLNMEEIIKVNSKYDTIENEKSESDYLLSFDNKFNVFYSSSKTIENNIKIDQGIQCDRRTLYYCVCLKRWQYYFINGKWCIMNNNELDRL